MERCDATLRQLDDLLDGELVPASADQVSHHLQHCADCRAEQERRRVLRERLRALPLEPLPDGFAERLDRRLSLALPERPRRAWMAWFVPAATAVAGFVAAAAVAAPLLATTPPGASSFARAAVAAGSVAASSSAGHAASPAPAAATMQAAVRSSVIHGATASERITSGSAGGATGVYAVTVLTPAPQEARHTVADLAAAATAAGGRVRTVIGPGATRSVANRPRPAATVDAVLPAVSAAAYVQSAGRYGTIMAKVGGVPPGSKSVRVLVTVLDAQREPAAVPTPHRGWGRAVLMSGGRAAPWVGGGLAGVLLVGLGWGLMRRRPL